MNWWNPTTATDAPAILVETLAHTLWQALIIAIVLWAALRLLSSNRTALRYGACTAALVAVVLSAFATAAILSSRPAPAPAMTTPTPSPTHAAARTTASPTITSPAHTATVPAPPHDFPTPQQGHVTISPAHAPLPLPTVLALAWAAGVILMLIRMIISLRGATRLKRSGTPLTDTSTIALLHEIQAALQITRTVTLRISNDVAGPVIVGILRPAILFPCSFLTAMPPEIIRAAIAHELAHIRRHDYLVNLGQMLVESLLFFNPCVWWISSQLRIERELCCDQVAVRVTGDAYNYAAALDHVATSISATPRAAKPTLAMHDNSRGTLLHRVRCVLLPHQRSALRLPWYSLLTTLATWCVIFTGLWFGSTTGVALAQKVFSDRERIDIIKKIEQDYGVPPSTGISNSNNSEPERTTVTGTLKLADGAHPSQRTTINVVSTQPRMASGGTINVRDGSFSESIVTGRVHMAATYPGYAPAFLGPYLLAADAPLDNLEITLHRGYHSSVRITDNHNNPITSATVTLSYIFPDKQNPLTRQTYTTDHHGVATIDHASTYPVKLDITAPGYEPTAHDAPHLPREQQLTIKLNHAKPVTGRVIDASTGQPIPNATLLSAAIRGPRTHSTNIATTGPVTDANGRFTLDNLRDDTVYDFLVEAPPRRPAWLTDVKAGDSDLEIRMGAPLIIRGTITGKPDKTTVWDHKLRERYPAIRVINWITYPGQHHLIQNRERFIPLETREGIGHFSAEGLYPGQVRLMWDAGTPKQLDLDLQESIENLELSTESGEGTGTEWTRTPAATGQSTRTVILKFETGSDAPPAGTIFLNYSGLPGDPHSASHSPIPITGDEMRFVVTIPSGVTCSPRGTLGYWFDDQRFQVPAGDDEFTHRVPCLPAGSISGVVLNRHGQPDPNAHISIFTTQRPSSLDDSHARITPDTITINNQGRFHITPLPVGATYTVTAGKDGNYVASDDITLTTSEPNRTITAQFPEGKPLNIQVVDEQGQPISGVPVKLLYYPVENSAHVITDQLTDRDGRLRLGNLNPDVRGSYRLDLPSRKNYQPLSMTVRPGESYPPITLRRGLAIHGRIVNQKTGEPISGDTAFALPVEHSTSLPPHWTPILAEEPTGPDGTFRFSNLPPGDHIFRVQGKGSTNHPTATAASEDPVEIQVNF